jgi:hypothetical protein
VLLPRRPGYLRELEGLAGERGLFDLLGESDALSPARLWCKVDSVANIWKSRINSSIRDFSVCRALRISRNRWSVMVFNPVVIPGKSKRQMAGEAGGMAVSNLSEPWARRLSSMLIAKHISVSRCRYPWLNYAASPPGR